MNLKVNAFNQSFGNRIPLTSSKAQKAASIMVKDNISGIVYSVLPSRPQYMYASQKKVIQYPVLVNGVDTVYNVRYPYPQNYIGRVGVEMSDKKGLDLQLLSAREIAKDIANKQEQAQIKQIAVG